VLAEHRDLVELIVPAPDRTTRTGLGLTRRHLGAVLAALGAAVSEPYPVPAPLAAGEISELFDAALGHEPNLRRAADMLLGGRFRIGLRRRDASFTRLLLALFLSVRYELGVGGVALLEAQPDLLGYYGRLFAAECGLPTQPPAEAAAAWALAVSSPWAAALNAALATSVAAARDDELFVVAADLPCMAPDDAAAFLRALSRGRAAGHRFVVVWPAMPPPRAGALAALVERRTAGIAALSDALRRRGIPAGPLDPERGFLTLAAHVNRLRRSQRVNAW
jgi:hypothetical protein